MQEQCNQVNVITPGSHVTKVVNHSHDVGEKGARNRIKVALESGHVVEQVVVKNNNSKGDSENSLGSTELSTTLTGEGV